MKKFCLNPHSELVKETQKKYNLSAKNAKAILENSMESDPSLQAENVTAEYIHKSEAFQDELLKFLGDASASDITHKQEFRRITLAKRKQAVKDALQKEGNLTDKEIDEIVSGSTSLLDNNRIAHVSSVKLAKVLKVLRNANRRDFLGNTICGYLSYFATKFNTDPEFAKKVGVTSHAERREYFTDPVSWRKLRAATRNSLKNAKKRLDDWRTEHKSSLSQKEQEYYATLSEELQGAVDNFDMMLVLYGGQLFRAEGVRVNIQGLLLFSEDRVGTKEEDGELDSRENTDPDGEEGHKDPFSANNHEESVMQKIAPTIKSLLSGIMDKNSSDEYRADKYGYGLPVFIKPSSAINYILKITKDCNTCSEMLEALSRNYTAKPWLRTVIQMMDTSNESQYDGIVVSKSYKEQLRTMFFQSFNKQFTPFDTAYFTKNKYGDIVIRSRIGNVRDAGERLWKKTITKYGRMRGFAIVKNGNIDLENSDDYIELRNKIIPLGTGSLDGRINNIAAMFAESNNPAVQRKAREEMAKLEKELLDIVKDFGIDVSQSSFDSFMCNGKPLYGKAFFSDDLLNIKLNKAGQLVDDLRKICKALEKRQAAIKSHECQDSFNDNPFSPTSTYDTPSYMELQNAYMDTISLLTEYSDDAFESMTYAGGKSFYSYGNRSSIQTVIRNLTNKNKEARDRYIAEKYGKDKYWYMTKDETGEDSFYADWLNDPSGLEYRERLMFNGKKYQDLSDMEYSLSILQDFFGNGYDQNHAWYRMLIASDKKAYSSIKATRYTGEGYKEQIEQQAEGFFIQELRRAQSVIARSLTDSVKIDKYDVQYKSEAQKSVRKKLEQGVKVTCNDVVVNGRYIFANTGASFFINKFLVREIENKTALGKLIVDRIFNYSSEKFNELHPKETLLTAKALSDFSDAFHAYMGEMLIKNMHTLYDNGTMQIQYVKGVNDFGDEHTVSHIKYLWGMIREQHPHDQYFDMLLHSESNIEKAVQWLAELDHIPEDVARDLFENNADAKRDLSYWQEIGQFSEELENFIYNNYLAKANMSEIFDIDLAFYGTTVEFQKRNAQIASAGNTLDKEALLHGKSLTDGRLRTIAIKTPRDKGSKGVMSKYIGNIDTALHRFYGTITDENRKAMFKSAMDNTLSELRKIDATDGQAFISLTGLRKKQVSLGEWSRSVNEELDIAGEDAEGNLIFTDEAIYQRALRGESVTEDYLHVFSQAKKPFTYSVTYIDRGTTDGSRLAVPVHHKNSEYMLSWLHAFAKQLSNGEDQLESQVDAIAYFLEETANGEFYATGIDTVNFDSATKVAGNSAAIDLEGLSPQETLEALRRACYQDGSSRESGYVEGAVIDFDMTDYKIQQTNPEHFKRNQQPIGSQMKVLAVNNIPPKSKVYVGNPGDKKTRVEMSGKELRDRYLAALSRKMEKNERDFKRQFALLESSSRRKARLSNILKNAMSSDQRYTPAMRVAMSIIEREGNDEFMMPLDEPTQQKAVEAMFYSRLRRLFFREKMNGGPCVQATSWGQKDDLAIRFYSSFQEDIDKRGGILMTKSEYSKNSGLVGGELESAYNNYKETYQAGLAYFELEAPMPDYIRNMLLDESTGEIADRYINADGTYNMDEIRKTVPSECFDAIAYRIPTEAKYSMMPCKIVRFSTEGGGSAAFFPKEITVFTGSDFDIDKAYIELRPIPGSADYENDNELFTLQFAALVSSPATQEMFKPGDFSDLSELSYRVTLERAGYSKSDIDKMSYDELKSECAKVEDLDLMDPSTDILLHRQNSEAGDMIAVAAVGVTSHAFISLYNDPDDPDISNKTRLTFHKPKSDSKKANESFIIVNDSTNGREPVTKEFSGDVVLDDYYDMDGSLISTEISKYVGASADAAKDAALYRLNITMKTLPLLVFMHRMGVSSRVARLVIAHPATRELVRKMETSETYLNLDSAISEVIDDIKNNNIEQAQEIEAAWNGIRHETVTLRASDLESGILDNIPVSELDSTSVGEYMKVFHFLEVIDKKAKLAKNLDSYTRYNSMKTMGGSSYIERRIKRGRLNKLQSNLESENIKLPSNIDILDDAPDGMMGVLYSMFPYIGKTIEGENSLVQQLVLENMHTYSQTFFELYDRLGVSGDVNSTVETTIMTKFYTAWKNYLLFVGDNRIVDFRDSKTAKFFTKGFAKYFRDKLDDIETNHPRIYKEYIEGNTFIERIYDIESNPDFERFTMLATDVNGMDSVEIQKFQADWETLMESPTTRPLAIGAAVHFLTRDNGARYSRSTPVHLIPLAVKEAIPNYTKVFTNADNIYMNEEAKTNFLAQFMLNNVDDSHITPHFYTDWKLRGAVRLNETEDGGFNLVIRGDETIKKFKRLFSGDAIKYNDEQYYVCKSPVIVVNGNIFVLTNELAKKQVTDGIEERVISVNPARSLGVPGQFQEYTGISYKDGSIFRTLEEYDGEERLPVIDDNYFRSEVRSGTYIEVSPYYGIEAESDEELDTYLASSLSAQDNPNSYIESRRFISRSETLAKYLGLSIRNVHKKLSSSDGSTSIPTYMLEVASDTNMSPTEKQQRTRQLSALISTLAGKKQDSAFTYTYCTDETKGNAYEIIIPYSRYAALSSISAALKESGTDNWTVDTASHTVRIYSSITGQSEKASFIALGKAVASMLRSKNLTDKATIELNTILADEDIDDTREKLLKALQNEVSKSETEKDQSGKAKERGRDNSTGGNQDRLGNLIEAALEINSGEKVDISELRYLFKESGKALDDTGSLELENKISELERSDSGSEVVTDIRQALTELQDERISVDALSRRIIGNTMKLVAQNRPSEWIKEAFSKLNEGILAGYGMSDSFNDNLVDSLLEEIRGILDKENIC